jgi:hypothetical protein
VDLDLPLLHGTRRLRPPARGHRELELREALDGAALGAHEVRVRGIVLVALRFEAPHVIADVGAAQQANLREIDRLR